MSIVKNIIDITAGVMGILFEKYETARGQAQEQAQGKGPEPEVETEPQTAEVDNLPQINGIGPTFASPLAEAGITTFAQLAALSPEQAREISHVTVQSDPADWTAEAQSLS